MLLPAGYRVCTGTLSADALGIVCCLYAYTHLSFQGDFDFGRTCAKHYHLLRHFMMDHDEVAAILGAILGAID